MNKLVFASLLTAAAVFAQSTPAQSTPAQPGTTKSAPVTKTKKHKHHKNAPSTDAATPNNTAAQKPAPVKK